MLAFVGNVIIIVLMKIFSSRKKQWNRISDWK